MAMHVMIVVNQQYTETGMKLTPLEHATYEEVKELETLVKNRLDQLNNEANNIN